MKLFSASEIKEIDKYTIESEGITSLQLMERAASAIACEIISRWLPSKRILIFAGPGNNGGDALAVARLLIEQGYKVEVFLFNIGGNKLSSDCAANKERLMALGDVDFTEIIKAFTPPYISKDTLVIDGLFGNGINKPLSEGFASLVRLINESGAYIISIDVPSGLFCEWNGENVRNNIIQARLTLTMQHPRLSFFFSENARYIGKYKVLDIELNQDAINGTKVKKYLVERNDIKRTLRRRNEQANKYDFGSLLLVAGSYGMLGASILAARGAMRAGAGLVSIHAPRCAMQTVQTAIPEAIFDADKHDIVTSDITLRHKYDAIAIGPGIGTNTPTIDALERFLRDTDRPLVLDADALNCIASRPSMLNNIPAKSVITPHAREFDRLFGEFYTDEQRTLKALDVASYYNIIIVLKGHHTMTIYPDGHIYVNSSGNVGMATAGSGDVLTGVIAALIAQGYTPEMSAVIGVYIHGYAGDLAEKAEGTYGVMASDICANVGRAIKEIMTLS